MPRMMSMSPAGMRGLVERLAALPAEERTRLIASMTVDDLEKLDRAFEAWAHPAQRPPEGNWRVWLIQAGRGFGKTRAGAEWVLRLATVPGRPVRIALVGATADEVRSVMVEGESGILASARGRPRPKWEPSLGRLTWPNGSMAFVHSAENPDGLRGPQHHHAWCDEVAKWSHAEETWNNLQMGMRLGEAPRTMVTTTPRPVPIMRRLAAMQDAVVTRGTTAENVTLPPAFLAAMEADYGATRLARQELGGELIDEVQGALWSRDLIERSRASAEPAGDVERDYARVVIGVDPPASSGGDACGIVAVGLGHDGVGYVIGDHSVAGVSPEGWASRVAAAAEAHRADLVVAEKNMGGDMVEAVLRSADIALPVRGAHAGKGKCARAEPVSLLFERGKARLAGCFPELEDEMAGMVMGGPYQGPGRSPDRADAMVWAMSEVMIGHARAQPRVRLL